MTTSREGTMRHATRWMKPARSVIAATILVAGLQAPALAQQKFKYVLGNPTAGKYTEQHTLDVGDAPGHQIRVATITTKFAGEAPTFDGVKALESTAWLMSDYRSGNGRFTQYTVLQMENGDKIYQTVEGQLQTSSSKLGYTTVATITGGTGKFATLRGVIRGSGVTDFKTGPSPNASEGEYWFER
jgi:hypothetical protein